MKGAQGKSGAAQAWRPAQSDIDAIVAGEHGDPFAVLGPHALENGTCSVRVFAPEAESVEVVSATGEQTLASLERLHEQGFYAGLIVASSARPGYRLRIRQGRDQR
jgi:1,4-alpha-glucan branching enzyme